MASWIQRYELEKARLAERDDRDPLLPLLADIVAPFETLSTRSILELANMPPTAANGRRIAPMMRELGFVPVTSARLRPGGRRGNVIRGWARPVPKAKQTLPTSNRTPASPAAH
jgi:hypothetical protein